LFKGVKSLYQLNGRQILERHFSPIDRVINIMDQALRLSTGLAPEPARANPAGTTPDTEFTEQTRKHVAGLMRVNHCGEICAQALYAGQAATARNEDVKREMNSAALDEIDHLAWCEQRLTELDSKPSIFNPLWYAGSFVIGAVAGIAGDGWSLGFVKETEIQVEAHLQDHLQQLPEEDKRSQAILDQMKTDEARHAEMAANAGAYELAQPIKDAMRFTSNIMKAVAYRL